MHPFSVRWRSSGVPSGHDWGCWFAFPPVELGGYFQSSFRDLRIRSEMPFAAHNI